MTMIKIHEDGQDREATEQEIQFLTSETEAFELAQKLKNDALTDKAAARQAVYAKLGLTADEAKMLLS